MEAVVGTLYGELIELVVVNQSGMGRLIGIVVLVGKILRAEHVQILSAEARIKGVQNLLGNVTGIVRSDSLG